MRFFDPEGPLMTALGTFADIVICNILFCIFCLPIVTIGASMAALFTCMQGIIYNEGMNDGLIFRDFWRAFRKNFKQATALWLLCLLILAFFVAYYWIVQSLGGAFAIVYQITFYLLILLFVFGFQYIFPLQARFENSVRNTLRNAWLLSIAALPWTVLNILLIIAAVYISFIMNPAAVDIFVYLWGVCGFALVAYLSSFIFRQAFKKLSPEKLTDESGVADGALFIDEEHRREDLMPQESSYSDPNWNRREDLLGPDNSKPSKKVRRR